MISRAQAVGFWLAAAGATATFVLPLSTQGAPDLSSRPSLSALVLAQAALFALAPCGAALAAALGLLGTAAGCIATLLLLDDATIAGAAGSGFWLLTLATWLGAALALTALAALRPAGGATRRLQELAVPLLFGAFVIYLWEAAVRGFGVSPVLLPTPSATATRLIHSLPTLGDDFVQTFVRGVLTGYAIGCGAGFLTAIVAHRFAFLARGLLPLGNFVSALPIVGIAPIMVMWFGFDWGSKAAVVAVMCFFPMLVNTLAGLSAAGRIERDLMRSYGARAGQTLRKLYLPAALPFVFNALKINSTLALIGAIVAEFFGTPTRGIGFRISIEVARMSLDMVWAEIALAAVAGMAFYGVVALAERATTFWHPSYRT
ncbi:MAG TPA: ABC transporter permease [Xanthobacteraceae bacterium]|nr:ABC transporter permease [Xanthobacteraceae bacterium]